MIILFNFNIVGLQDDINKHIIDVLSNKNYSIEIKKGIIFYKRPILLTENLKTIRNETFKLIRHGKVSLVKLDEDKFRIRIGFSVLYPIIFFSSFVILLYLIDISHDLNFNIIIYILSFILGGCLFILHIIKWVTNLKKDLLNRLK